MGHARISGNVVRLHSAKPVGPVHAALATATGDATIRVLYLTDDDPPTWVDVSGARRDPVESSDGRSSTTVELDGAVMAAVEHAAETAPERIESACEALAADIEQEQRIACLFAQVRVLEGAEQRLRDVFDAVELVVAAMDLDACMTYVNPFTERLSGWTRDELVGQNWFEMFRSGRESFLDRVRAGEFPPRDESTIIVKNDERRQIDWYNVALRDEDGRVEGVLGIGRDKTDEVRTQRSLEAAHRRMHDVLETVELVATQLDLDGSITYANEYLVRLSGWTRDELIGRRWLEVFDTGHDFMEQVRRQDFPAHDKSSILLRSGERRDIEWANVGLYDDHGRLNGLVGIGRDVTDQLRVEQELRELASEHGALERVATEVARGLDEDAVFRLVAEQAGRLVAADGCTLVRVEPGGHVRILSNSSEVAADRVAAEGMLVPIDSGPAMAAAFMTGRPERSDQAPDEPGRPNPIGDDINPIRSAVAAPITVTGETWGALVAWRVSDEPLSPDTERRLGAFASLAGTAIANADARTALAASRKRIVTSADQARRRLERNLHDGAQQRFVSLSLALRLTMSLLESDPARAAEHLQGAQRELTQGLEELRELARGIHPAILTERGLRAAVDSLVLRAQVPVDVDRHAGGPAPARGRGRRLLRRLRVDRQRDPLRRGGRATVAVILAGGVVAVEVNDDGKGGARPALGSGLSGLADRVEAIGGRLEIASPPGAGTRIRAVLPCDFPAGAERPCS